jgi:membrane-bound metal-dependent hydrolase YbcI (DUF457 family)
MDIVSHAAAGAATGAVAGHPWWGAFFGVLPDLVLGYKRIARPTAQYLWTHSLCFLLLVWFLVLFFLGDTIAMVALLALVSHVALDIPTHGSEWAPRLFYPFWDHPFSLSHGGEWEWFNSVWWEGFLYTVIWITLCLTLTA